MASKTTQEATCPGEVSAANDHRKELTALVERAAKGDQSALPAVREMLDRLPRLWQEAGDLARHAEEAIAKVITGDDAYFREALCRKVEALRSELAGPDCTPLERVLVDRVVVCWLHANYADAIYAQSMGDCSFQLVDYRQRRQDRTHRRLLSAVRTLALVRRLGLPAMQVNIAEKQINVAQ
jgi:hypothetical protein